MDPAGAFRSEQVDQYMLKHKIMSDHIPAEAHWELPVVERAIRTTKEMMTKISSEFPEMSEEELFQRALWAQNSRDQYLGYSPLQHVLGRNPNDQGQLHNQGCGDVPVITEKGLSAEFGNDMRAMQIAEEAFLEEQYRQRLMRAKASGARKSMMFKPGDLVFYWRKQMGNHGGETKGQNFKKGGFIGPARVLATETKVESDGQRRPTQHVWLFRGSKLLKATPNLLRHASEREEAWAELQEDHPIPWTISGMLEQGQTKTYEDLTGETPPEPEDLEDDPVIHPESPTPSRRRHLQKEPANVFRPLKQHRRDGQERSRRQGEQLEQDRTKQIKLDHALAEHPLVAFAADTPTTVLDSELGCIQISIDLPQNKKHQKGLWLRDLPAYLVSQTRKNHIEVSERRLTPEELEQFKSAKDKEVRNYIMAEVFRKIPDHLKPDQSQILKMRWILTWKVDKDHPEQRKAKARAVILGYQDPLYEWRPTSSPTMSKGTRQMFLTLCAAYHFTVEKGDISGAFLQGREVKDEIFVEPHKEITEAMGIAEGSTTRLVKAAYGLVQAPLEFYLTVDEFLMSQGFIRQKSDPCCWGLYDDDNRPIGWICSHVDDFMFGGLATDSRWLHAKTAIKERFKFGEWEQKKFIQCGVTIEQREDFSFSLSQPEFLDQVSEVFINKQRLREPEQLATEDEKKQLRSVLGCLAWHAGQLAMELSAPTGLLLSRVPQAKVTDLLEANKLLRKAKLRQGQKMIIHALQKEDSMLTAWVDAAHGNRQDLSSTKGIIIGCTPKRVLDGDLVEVSPIYWCSSKISRVCRSSASAETRAAVDEEDQLFALRFQMAEFLGHHANIWNPCETVGHVEGALISDSKNVYDRLNSTVLTLSGAEKRSDIETLCLKEAIVEDGVQLRWVNGESQLANSLTKHDEPHQPLMFSERNGRWRIVYDEGIISGKKRKQQGKGPLDGIENGI